MSRWLDTPLNRKCRLFTTNALLYVEWMNNVKHERIVSNQLKRATVSVGACISEAQNAESAKDMLHKLSIAIKEARECEFYLTIVKGTELYNENHQEQLSKQLNEVVALLVKSTHTLRQKIKRSPK